MSGADKGCRLSCFEIRAALHGISAIGAMDKTCQRILHDSIYTCWSIMLFHFRLCKIPEFFWDDGFMQTINEQIIFCQRTRFFDFSIFRMFFFGAAIPMDFPDIYRILQHTGDGCGCPCAAFAIADAHLIQTLSNGGAANIGKGTIRLRVSIGIQFISQPYCCGFSVFYFQSEAFFLRQLYPTIAEGGNRACKLSLFYGCLTPTLHAAEDGFIFPTGHKLGKFKIFLIKFIIWVIRLHGRDNLCGAILKGI